MLRWSFRRWQWAVAFLGVPAAYACVTTSFDDGRFTCEPAGSGACPPGLLCAADGFCRSSDVDAGLDAGSDVDAGGGRCAGSTWRINPSDRFPRVLALGRDDLYVGGKVRQGDSVSGWIARLDPCTGIIRDQVIFQILSVGNTGVYAIFSTDNGLVVAGSASGKGEDGGTLNELFTARVDWEREKVVDLVRSPRASTQGMLAGALSDDGAMWFSGGTPTPSVGWLVKRDAGASRGCELLTEKGDSVLGLLPSPNSGGIYSLVRFRPALDAGSRVLELRPDCTIESQFLARDPLHEPTDFTLANGKIYVTGSFRPTGGNRIAFLSEVASPWITVTEDFSPGDDTFRAVASDGDALFVGAGVVMAQYRAIPHLFRYPLPFAGTTTKTWDNASVFGSGSDVPIWDVVAAPRGEDGIFVSGGSDETGVLSGGIARCTKSGKCNN